MPVKLISFAGVITVDALLAPTRRSIITVDALLALMRRLVCYLLLVGYSALSYAEQPLCALQGSANPVTVSYINDGDTLILDDDKRVRMIGINAPELAHEDKPGQPLAVQARERLQSYLRGGKALLVYDKERRDKYGRILAHVFDTHGVNVSAALIRDGLGFAVAIPPNLRYRECYRAAEKQALRAELGVWNEAYFEPIFVNNIRKNGFQRVFGCIQKITKHRNIKYLHLSRRFRFSIKEENEAYFTAEAVAFEKGLCLAAKGWVYGRVARRGMELLHPDAMQVIHATRSFSQ